MLFQKNALYTYIFYLSQFTYRKLARAQEHEAKWKNDCSHLHFNNLSFKPIRPSQIDV